MIEWNKCAGFGGGRALTQLTVTALALFGTSGVLAAQRWTPGSRRDAMTDQRIVWADLPASTPVQSSWGTYRPFIEIICFPKDSSILFRLYGSVPAKLDETDPYQETYATIRFDTEPPRTAKFKLTDVGRTYVMELAALVSTNGYGYAPDPLRPSWDYWGSELRDGFFRDLLTARRMLVRYTLLPGDTPTVEFRLGPLARPAAARVFGACHVPVPTGPPTVGGTP